MGLQIASLNSGSNANCYYIGNGSDAVLIDAGLSCRETEKRMVQLGLSLKNIQALFISHEHADHITGMAGIAKKYNMPVYITPATFQKTYMPVAPDLIHTFKHNQPVRIGNLSVMPFRKNHDAGDPHSFMISQNGLHVGVITDIGYACKQVIKHFSKCHAVFLEANYCPDMLANGSYPYHLKKRISGDEGHLSNTQALDLFVNYRSPQLQLLILSHLSKNNNWPELVENLFAKHAGNTKIVVASRYRATELFLVENNMRVKAPAIYPKKIKQEQETQQLSLF
jgi:phosphoribosyl 1,2-cyclic phosphodiesterase